MGDYYNFDSMEFKTDDELETFVQNFSERYNKMPVDDFCGLSPEDMQQLLYSPFDSPEIVEFKQVLDSPPSAPVATLFTGIIEAIGKDGVKCTAKGNLPRKVVNRIARVYLDEFGSDLLPPRNSFSSEFDFDELYITRIIAKALGLIRKYRGKFFLTKKCNQLLAGDGMKAIYPMLLRAFATRFTWSSRDGHAEIRLIQDSFAYSLFLLNKFGNKKRKASFYEDAFLKAYPFILEEAESNEYHSKEDSVRSAYSLRCLHRFAELMGLVKIDSRPNRFRIRDPELKATPLLASAVRFRVP